MDKNKIVSYYNTKGYRDAQILSDSIWRTKNGRLRIHLNIEEGKRYYYRNIFIKENSLYSEDQIRNVLAIQSSGEEVFLAKKKARLNFLRLVVSGFLPI